MDYLDYEDQEIDFDIERLDAEWVGLNALRELLRIASKGLAIPTYAQALQFGKDLAPDLYGQDISLIANALEPLVLREYRQRADAETQIEGNVVTPLALIDREIDSLEKLLNAQGPKDRIRSKLNSLYSIRRSLKDETLSENQIIIRDVFKAERPEIPNPPVDTNTYREYRLPYGKGLRIRMLHPEKPEHTTGADLIYEISSDREKKARLALVQYKVWDGEVLYLSDERMLNQIKRLKDATCDAGRCDAHQPDNLMQQYRLPYCTAFLRPTNRLQSPDARLISKGIHVPLCKVEEMKIETSRGGDKLLKKDIGDKAVSQRIFEELFNRNMLGSRWLNYEQVESFYRDNKIMDAKDKIVLHAQEFWLRGSQ